MKRGISGAPRRRKISASKPISDLMNSGFVIVLGWLTPTVAPEPYMEIVCEYRIWSPLHHFQPRNTKSLTFIHWEVFCDRIKKIQEVISFYTSFRPFIKDERCKLVKKKISYVKRTYVSVQLVTYCRIRFHV